MHAYKLFDSVVYNFLFTLVYSYISYKLVLLNSRKAERQHVKIKQAEEKRFTEVSVAQYIQYANETC